MGTIDIVGGTSIGANIGALLCEERDAEKREYFTLEKFM